LVIFSFININLIQINEKNIIDQGGSAMTVIDEQMKLASQLARSGEKERAHYVFTQVVAADPQNVQAWLWLSELASDLEEQVAMLDQAMKYMPEGPDGRKDIQAQLNEMHGFITLPGPAEPLPQNDFVEASTNPLAETRALVFGTEAEADPLIPAAVIPPATPRPAILKGIQKAVRQLVRFTQDRIPL
jgi:hypothetical protein